MTNQKRQKQLESPVKWAGGVAFWLALAAAAGALGNALPARADSLSLSAGTYSLSARAPSGKEASASGVGTYNLQYSYDGFPHVALQAGYTLIMSGGVGGDLANGLEFGASYYPLSENGTRTWKELDNLVRSGEVWRPYGGLAFLQRQVESSSYSGFVAKAGVERSLNYPWSLKAEVKRSAYSSSSKFSSVEMSLMVGGVLEF
jgi:hypothetical protein